MADKTVVLNIGTRTWDLKPGPKGEIRKVLPGQAIETLDDDEAKALLNHFRDFKDAAKVMPANADKTKAMQAEIDRLTAENTRMAAKEDKKGKEKKGA